MKTLSNPNREQAAQLIAEGRYEYSDIAEKIGVDRRTLHKWRQEPKFAARVDHISREFADGFKKLAIARQEYRLRSLNRLHLKLETLLDQRAADMAKESIPGGDQGVIVRQYKVSGENQVTEYVFDRAVFQEMRAIQEQAAKELGQLVEKHEHKINSVKDLSDEELDALDAELGPGGEAEGGDSQGEGAPAEG
jgi:transposase-like protein